MNLSTLPSVPDAKLPSVYTEAVSAIQRCDKIDECRDWANKAEAMASYAKQANDQTLRKTADRIQARAIRRCGELLKQIEPAKNQYDASARDPSVPSTRTQAAKEAGLSERQRKTALRVASVPENEFEEAVESEIPPTVTKLAEAGKKPGFQKATEILGTLRRFSKFCDDNDPVLVASGLMENEYEKATDLVKKIDQWLDVFVTNIGD